MATKLTVDSDAVLYVFGRDALNGFTGQSSMTGRGASDAPTALSKRIPRRRVTGRNQQFNIKAKGETIAEFYALADVLDVPLGELLERALAALRREEGGK